MLPCLLLGLAMVVSALSSALNGYQIDPAVIEGAIHNLGVWAPMVYVALFALATVLFVPGALGGLAGGMLFGPERGTILNLAGATVGATAAFLVARYMAAERVRRQADRRLDQLIKGVEVEGWRGVAFAPRPILPFNLLNYARGLTHIQLVVYVLASFVCMLPGTLAYTYLGYAGREALSGGGLPIRNAPLWLWPYWQRRHFFLPRLVRRLHAGQQPEAARVGRGSWSCRTVS
jgi:uncharacterized membrane protein YdjX (TVP38/TMEM64 family)